MSKRIEAPLAYSEIGTISQFQVSHENFQISGKNYFIQKSITKSDTLSSIKKEKPHISWISIIFGRHVSLQNNVHFFTKERQNIEGI